MSALSVEPPYPAFADADGQPLEDGYILIGTVNLNPITNPIAVFFDAGLTISAVQPIRTSGGYPFYDCSTSVIYTATDYSIQVQNKNGTVVYTSMNGNASITTSSNAAGTGTQTIFPVTSTPLAIYINGVYQNQNTYTFANGNVTFTQAPPLNSIIEFVF